MKNETRQPLRRILLTCALLLTGVTGGCARRASAGSDPVASPPQTAVAQTGVLHARHLRLTGSVQAVRSLLIRPPTVQGASSMMTLVHLVANGAQVKKGDVLAEFDATDEVERARQARAKYDGLVHQVEQKVAQNRSDAEQRNATLQQARADLAKAQLEIRKAPILSQIDADKARVNEQDAAAHVASLLRSNPLQDKADAAALNILELQRDRQKLEWQRAEENIEHTRLLAPLSGVVALKSIFRNGSFGTAQEGDKIYRGNPLLSIFDPGAMVIRADLNEADHVQVPPGMKATVHLDAYPSAVFSATVQSVSPVATAPLGSPARSFTVLLNLDQRDARLMPDLAAAVDLTLPNAATWRRHEQSGRPLPAIEAATAATNGSGSKSGRSHRSPPAALLIPRSAVKFAHDRAWVRAQRQGQWQWQPVTLGAFDKTRIAVLSGLHQGEAIELAPLEAIPAEALTASAMPSPEAAP